MHTFKVHDKFIVKLKNFNLWQPMARMSIKADEVFYYKQPRIKRPDI